MIMKHRGFGMASCPKLRRVQPVYPSRSATDFLHEVLRTAGSVTALSVPQANEIDLLGTESASAF
jgi:hypothetical protein